MRGIMFAEYIEESEVKGGEGGTIDSAGVSESLAVD